MASTAMALSVADVGAIAGVGANGITAGTILNPEGKGDVLLFPYYDVRQLAGRAQDFYFAIINDQSTFAPLGKVDGGVAAKLRFREFDKSIEVYDVDIWLSCDDVWVGLITQDPVAGKPRIWSPDNVIVAADDTGFTVDDVLNVVDPATGALIGRSFLPELNNVPAPRSLYGYFELIGEEMTACKASAAGRVTRRGGPGALTRPDCPNSLSGYAYSVRVDEGIAMAYNATAIANFSRTQGSLFVGPGQLLPTLLEAEDTIDQLEFMLSKRTLSQGYSAELTIGAKYSILVNFPTKHFHFATTSPFGLNLNTLTYNVGQRPRGEPFNGTTANAGEEISVTIWDRNENPFKVPPGFESPPVQQNRISLPYEVNIIGIYPVASSPTLTNPRDNLGLPTGGFLSGWWEMDLDGTATPSVFGTHTKALDAEVGPPASQGGNLKIAAFNWFGNFFEQYFGLPTIAMIAQEFSNGAVGGAYGEFLPVYYSVDWSVVFPGIPMNP